ncbi:MAG: cyclic nucleotide-binding domain-containing protein, partial [Gammaproteobacteria bacterium]
MPDNQYMHALQIPGETEPALSLGGTNPCVERFLEHCHRRKYPNKSVIIYAGDQPDALYYIVKGSVSVLMEDEDGHEIVLAYINAGGFFGEMGLFGEQSNRSAWIRTR